jgi:hypothetical protein
MKMMQFLWLALAATAPVLASAQWQWVDQDGRKVFSDRPPPPDVPDKNILKRSAGSTRGAVSDDPAIPASAATARPAGKDAVLEARKKQGDDEDEAKRRAVTDKQARDRGQNCDRARKHLAVLKSGIRLKLPNSQGEIEFISDADRAAEIERVQGILSADCP